MARALSYSAPSQLSYVDVEAEPAPLDGEVIVRPHFTGVCGTDLLIWHDGHSRAAPPVVLGHEFAGEVTAVGGDVEGVAVGDLVAIEPLLGCGACRPCLAGDYNQCGRLRLIGVDVDGSLAPLVRAPAERVLRLPEGVDARAGAFIEPTAVVCHLLRRIGALAAGSAVFVAGGGPIGLIAAEILIHRGHRVLVVESNGFRADVARELGAEVASSFEEAERASAESGVAFAACIEATGVPGALATCIRVAGEGASIGVVGLPKAEPEVDITAVIGKELDLHGSRVYVRADFEEAAGLIAAGVLSLDRHITHVVAFDDAIAEGFEAIERREPILKLLVDQRDAGTS